MRKNGNLKEPGHTKKENNREDKIKRIQNSVEQLWEFSVLKTFPA